MLARDLETLLYGLTNKIGVGSVLPSELSIRFDRLRGSGLIPHGPGQSATKLSIKQITSSILSLCSTNPEFSATVSKICYNLKPVGGRNNGFSNCETFGEAIDFLLTDDNALKHILDVRVSDSEIFTNSNCIASVTYENSGIKTTYYVSHYAVSLLTSGAQETFNPRNFTSKAIREIVLFREFFSNIKKEIEREKLWPSEPRIDPRVEKIKEEKIERKKKLGIIPGSRFLSLAIDHQVMWPKTETVVKFEGYNLILTPADKNTAASIHIDLHGQRINTKNARTLFSRFLSILTWQDDQYAVLQEGVSGNVMPVPMPKRNLAHLTSPYWFFNDINPLSTEGKKALAIYREGRNAEQSFLVSYAVLSYYKIFEIKYRHKNDILKEFKNQLERINETDEEDVEIKVFFEMCNKTEPAKYLYNSCRVAVAHANEPYTTDPDDSDELSRLHNAAYILRKLARKFLVSEFQIPSH